MRWMSKAVTTGVVAVVAAGGTSQLTWNTVVCPQAGGKCCEIMSDVWLIFG